MSLSLPSLAPSPALLRERCNALSCVYGRTLTLEESAEPAAKRLRLSSDEACAYLIRAVHTLSRRCTPRWAAAAPPECSPWKIQTFRPADRLFSLPFPAISPIMLSEHILGGFAHGDDP